MVVVVETVTKPSRFDTFCSLLARCTIPCACQAKRHLSVKRHFFHTFDLKKCFVPHGHSLFRHLNFQKFCECEVFLAFSLANVLRATTACNYSSLISPDGSAPAALARLLFGPREPQIIGINTGDRDFPTLSCTCIFFLLTLSSDSFSSLIFSSLLFSSLLFSSLCFSSLLFSSLLFSSLLFVSLLFVSLLFVSLLFSDSFHLCFPSVHTVGSLTLNFLRKYR